MQNLNCFLSCRDDDYGIRQNNNNTVGYRSVISRNGIKCVLRHLIYFGRQVQSNTDVNTLENGLAVRNMPSVLKHILFHFVKPPCDALLCYY